MNRFLNGIRSIVKKFAPPLIIALLVVLCISIIVLNLRFESFASRVGGNGVEAGQAMENLRQSVVMLSKDAQEMRELMRLPAHDYPFSKADNSVDKTLNLAKDENPNEPFFKGLDYLKIEGLKSRTQDFLQKIKTDESFAQTLRTFGLRLRTKSADEVEITKGETLIYNLVISNNSGTLDIIAPGSGSIPFMDPQNIENLKNLIKVQSPKVIENITKLGPMIQFIEGLDNVDPVKKLITRRVLNIDDSVTESTSIRRSLRRSDGSKLAVLGLDYQKQMFFIDETFFASQKEFASHISAKIESLDLRTAKDVFVDKNRELLKNLANDKGFVAFANEQGLRLSKTERSDSDYFYYDVTGADNLTIGSFAVQKWEGTLWIMDPRDIPISRLDSLDFSKLVEKKN